MQLKLPAHTQVKSIEITGLVIILKLVIQLHNDIISQPVIHAQ